MPSGEVVEDRAPRAHGQKMVIISPRAAVIRTALFPEVTEFGQLDIQSSLCSGGYRSKGLHSHVSPSSATQN